LFGSTPHDVAPEVSNKPLEPRQMETSVYSSNLAAMALYEGVEGIATQKSGCDQTIAGSPGLCRVD
jgi:hypothetical protein